MAHLAGSRWHFTTGLVAAMALALASAAPPTKALANGTVTVNGNDPSGPR